MRGNRALLKENESPSDKAKVEDAQPAIINDRTNNSRVIHLAFCM